MAKMKNEGRGEENINMSCPVLSAQLPAQPAMQLDVPFGFANFHVEAFLFFPFTGKDVS